MTVKEARQFIDTEMNRRRDLIEDPDFRKLCIEAAQNMGVTAKEWNDNKMFFLMMFANKACKIEDDLLK